MTADLLRQAAALIRERAEAATPGAWGTVTSAGIGISAQPHDSFTFATTHHVSGLAQSAKDATHIASWHPAVALAVADWLELTADRMGTPAEPTFPQRRAAEAVARAYLDTPT